ncbi:hypothetical protein DENSPDRAFT_501073 [Dentipellis sp. KUC8613]|nr:hypothetical protein DENSPDRAFT_501073 [Dentipellis sp. KUC8613]
MKKRNRRLPERSQEVSAASMAPANVPPSALAQTPSTNTSSPEKCLLLPVPSSDHALARPARPGHPPGSWVHVHFPTCTYRQPFTPLARCPGQCQAHCFSRHPHV